MRALVTCLMVLLPATGPAFAQGKPVPKTTVTQAVETRYVTAFDGFMDGQADVILKETRQGKAVTAAVLDVCYPVQKGSERRDRFVANLAVSGQTLTGSTQSLGDKVPVSVKLTRKPTAETFDFRGQIAIGSNTSEVASADTTDLSEKEFADIQSSDDSIVAEPKDFTEVSPDSIAVRIKLDTAAEFLKALKGQPVAVALSSLNVSCEALRAGEQVIGLSIDPDRAAAFILRARATPGVVAAGWVSGLVDMERSIRLAAAEWRSGDTLDRDKLVGAIAPVLGKTIGATLASATWNNDTGKLKLIFKRPSELFPALGLTETVEFAALAGPDRPGSTDRLLLWISNPLVTTADESAGPKLNLAEISGGDEESFSRDDNGALDAVARELRGQRWDADRSTWK